jgi:cytochrome c oxidase cbb3-type subunit III
MQSLWKASGAALVTVLLVACGADKYPTNTASAAGLAMSTPMPPIGPDPGAGPGEGHTQEPQLQNPFEGSQIAREQGRQLFVQMNCYGCHGGHGGGGMGPSLRDPQWIYGATPIEIYSSIAQGRAHGMPAWGLRLPSDVIWKLVAYIRSLGTQEEPDPPTPAPAEAPPMAAPQPGVTESRG